MSWAPAFLANPERFMAFSRWAAPMFGAIAVLCALAGLWLGFAAPPDYQQGLTVRILFIHIPAAWMCAFVYACLAGAVAGAGLYVGVRVPVAGPHSRRGLAPTRRGRGPARRPRHGKEGLEPCPPTTTAPTSGQPTASPAWCSRSSSARQWPMPGA